MTTSTSIAELHNRVHGAALNARDKDNWWNGSLETGLAAAAGSFHPKGASRRIGELGLNGLLRWYDMGDARNISDDAAALALGALAAERMQGGIKRLRDAALETLSTVLSSANRAPIAPLHLALAAWALRQIVPVSDESPWPELRERLPQMPAAGVDELLVRYAEQLATKEIDPLALARVLQDVPDVYPTEYPMLLWALWSGSIILAELLPEGDPNLEVVRSRRTNIFEAIAAELAEDRLVPDVTDYDPFPEEDIDLIQVEPDAFNMLMIDLALSPEMQGVPARTPMEFKIALEQKNRPWIYGVAGTVELGAVLATAIAVLTALLLHARLGIIIGAATVTFAALSLVAMRLWNRVGPVTRFRAALTDASLGLLLLGILVIVNWAPHKPLFVKSEFATVAVDIGGPIAFLALSALVRALVERRETAPK
jgi:hypothetical protein